MARRSHPAPSPAVCPVCGEPVPPRSPACPECGADERSGWNDKATRLDGLDLPGDEGMDYEEFMHREFGVRPARRLWIPITAAVLLVALFLWAWL